VLFGKAANYVMLSVHCYVFLHQYVKFVQSVQLFCLRYFVFMLTYHY